jgi:hypothetical protein
MGFRPIGPRPEDGLTPRGCQPHRPPPPVPFIAGKRNQPVALQRLERLAKRRALDRQNLRGISPWFKSRGREGRALRCASAVECPAPAARSVSSLLIRFARSPIESYSLREALRYLVSETFTSAFGQGGAASWRMRVGDDTLSSA